MIVCDILPTLAHLSGGVITQDMKIEGINIWPAVRGESLSEERVFYWRTEGQLALRMGDWKLIRNSGRPDEGKEELYNITKDPYEQHNLAAQNLPVMTEMRKELVRQFSMDKKM